MEHQARSFFCHLKENSLNQSTYLKNSITYHCLIIGKTSCCSGSMLDWVLAAHLTYKMPRTCDEHDRICEQVKQFCTKSKGRDSWECPYSDDEVYGKVPFSKYN
eukprot:g81886.t1